jgi:hypothetical protein
VTKKLNVVQEAHDVLNPVQNSVEALKSKSVQSKTAKVEKANIPADMAASNLLGKMRELKNDEANPIYFPTDLEESLIRKV